MIVSFANPETEEIYLGNQSKKARSTCPVELWKLARRKLGYVNSATKLDDLKMPPGQQAPRTRPRQEGTARDLD